MNKWYKAYDIFINGTKLGRLYSRRKVIEIAEKESNSLFEGQRHIEIVETETGEVIYNT